MTEHKSIMESVHLVAHDGEGGLIFQPKGRVYTPLYMDKESVDKLIEKLDYLRSGYRGDFIIFSD